MTATVVRVSTEVRCRHCGAAVAVALQGTLKWYCRRCKKWNEETQ